MYLKLKEKMKDVLLTIFSVTIGYVIGMILCASAGLYVYTKANAPILPAQAEPYFEDITA